MTPNQFCYNAHQAHTLLPHGDRPTKKHMRVARLLARWQHPCPSHAKLARAAGCCVRTVQNALNRFRGLGLLSWHHQGRVTRWGQRLRLTNRYLFDAPFSLFAVPPRKKASEGREEILSPESLVGKLSDDELQTLRVKYGLA